MNTDRKNFLQSANASRNGENGHSNLSLSPTKLSEKTLSKILRPLHFTSTCAENVYDLTFCTLKHQSVVRAIVEITDLFHRETKHKYVPSEVLPPQIASNDSIFSNKSKPALIMEQYHGEIRDLFLKVQKDTTSAKETQCVKRTEIKGIAAESKIKSTLDVESSSSHLALQSETEDESSQELLEEIETIIEESEKTSLPLDCKRITKDLVVEAKKLKNIIDPCNEQSPKRQKLLKNGRICKTEASEQLKNKFIECYHSKRKCKTECIVFNVQSRRIIKRGTTYKRGLEVLTKNYDLPYFVSCKNITYDLLQLCPCNGNTFIPVEFGETYLSFEALAYESSKLIHIEVNYQDVDVALVHCEMSFPLIVLRVFEKCAVFNIRKSLFIPKSNITKVNEQELIFFIHDWPEKFCHLLLNDLLSDGCAVEISEENARMIVNNSKHVTTPTFFKRRNRRWKKKLKCR